MRKPCIHSDIPADVSGENFLKSFARITLLQLREVR